MFDSSICLPAEWAPQQAIMLTWPHSDTDWAARLAEVEAVFINIARAIVPHESLIITCRDNAHKKLVYTKIKAAHIPLDRVSFYIHASNDSWARDYAPITLLKNNQPHLLDFEFNGWGNKYPAEKDNRLSRALYKQGAFGNTPFTTLPFVLEGGSIDSDGQGTLLTTRNCLLSPTRNASQSQADIEKRLQNYLGTKRILWLEHGYLQGDDTDSHVDMLARFCNPKTIAYSCCENKTDEHFICLQAMKEELACFYTNNGTTYQLVPLPIPQAIYNERGQRLPASYANFLIINQAVLVPQYNDPADKAAIHNIQSCFPSRQIIGVNCLAIIQQYGSLHCLTMQLTQGITDVNET